MRSCLFLSFLFLCFPSAEANSDVEFGGHVHDGFRDKSIGDYDRDWTDRFKELAIEAGHTPEEIEDMTIEDLEEFLSEPEFEFIDGEVFEEAAEECIVDIAQLGASEAYTEVACRTKNRLKIIALVKEALRDGISFPENPGGYEAKILEAIKLCSEELLASDENEYTEDEAINICLDQVTEELYQYARSGTSEYPLIGEGMPKGSLAAAGITYLVYRIAKKAKFLRSRTGTAAVIFGLMFGAQAGAAEKGAIIKYQPIKLD